ncbi:3-phenylpropionate/trans-cinnamate dioxygenase ferredoxin subunit [Microbacterium endophyticum]|uniref:3-phenylpropionate/trans-cinnamate dioxygenase ferredoxin subunit n=1 Tax=Microbacterium endophyticum TaxID=1526412 RepID=A0A7W4V4A4_9MICO|nr:Rieske 2Fe-2S domain-containing protein [Microbacterium endophyticum]MBB2975918.1 3-phenylpropionate/trans-cinnamate dioxygenase ferredoxin subunit [Microbacterium endophyticum]NIK36401.1 3-phenylpropionate/trans-cinnamate dioxygenase ferredoxin subunit [Microbacterium endophyticum]
MSDGTGDAAARGIVVAHVGEIEDGTGLKVSREQSGTLDDIAVFNDGENYFALDNTCTHEKTDLADGWVEDGCVECPLHGAKFRLSDGDVLTPPAPTGVAAHTIRVDGDDIVLIPNPARLA